MSECWIENTFEYEIPGFNCRYVPRKLCRSKQGGGMALLIKNELEQYLEIVDVYFDTIIWLKLDGTALGMNENLYICCTYIPPDKSSFFKQYNCDIFYELENQIADFSEKGQIMIVGDLNSRCSTLNDYIECDRMHDSLSEYLSPLCDYKEDDRLIDRICPDFER